MSKQLSRARADRPSMVSVLVNAPLAASLMRHHFQRTRSKALSVGLRRSPPWVRAVMASPPVRGIRPDLSALSLAASGQSAQGLDVLRSVKGADVSGRRRTKRLTRVARSAMVLHDAPLAREALGRLATSGGGGATADVERTRALVAAEEGRLSEAVDALAAHRDVRSRVLSDRLRALSDHLQACELREALVKPPAPRQSSELRSAQTVLHVVSKALPEQQAGYTIRTHGIVTAQREAGMNAHVVSRLGYPVDVGVLGARADVEVDGVPYHRLLPRRPVPAVGRRRTVLAADALSRVIEACSPDLLHAHSKHDNAQVSLIAARQTSLPVVYEMRGFLEETWRSAGGSKQSDFYRWSRESETLCMNSSDAVVALSAAMAEDIMARGVDAARVTVVPNSVPEAFTRPLLDGTGMRIRLGIKAGATVFGTVSTLNDYEGLDTTIAALCNAEDEGIVLVIVGDGPARSSLQRQAEPLGTRVIFTGRVPHAQVREYLAVFDVFVVPRRSTPVTVLVPPIKPLEAMAVGKPVLASALAPLIEIVQPGVLGEIAPPADPVAWAEAMTALRYAPEHVRDLGARAAQFVARERTWARAVDRYADVYATAVRR